MYLLKFQQSTKKQIINIILNKSKYLNKINILNNKILIHTNNNKHIKELRMHLNFNYLPYKITKI